MAVDRLPDAVEAALDTGESTILRATAVMVATDGSLERSRSVLAGADEAIERASRVLDTPDSIS